MGVPVGSDVMSSYALSKDLMQGIFGKLLSESRRSELIEIAAVALLRLEQIDNNIPMSLE